MKMAVTAHMFPAASPWRLLVIAVTVGLLFFTKTSLCAKARPNCPRYEGYNRCGTHCEETCKNLGQQRPCPKTCHKGCFCLPGYVRRYRGGRCIRRHQCPTKRCPRDEVYNSCGTCETTCQNLGHPRVCAAGCHKGCFCKPGHVRRNHGGQCIKQSQCPTKRCPRNEVYNSCGTCETTCQNLGHPRRVCAAGCHKGCFCKPGYVRRNHSGQCIKQSQCPTKRCPRYEVYNSCGAFCQTTCQNPRQPRVCASFCRKGCFCKPGYVRRNHGGQCIKQSQCPKTVTCPLYEVYLKTPPTCITICLGLRPVCRSYYRPGCYCKGGYVRLFANGSGPCVSKASCQRKG